jgi:hypothetical protein
MPSRRKSDFKQHGDKFVYVSPNFQKQFSVKDDVVEVKTEVPLADNGEKVEIKIDVPLKEKKEFKKLPDYKKKKKKGINLSVDETVTDDHD